MATRSALRVDENADPRHFGTSTDDTAIYLEDSMDEPTARCISSSPSVVAILSPQRLPSNSTHAIDITEYDSRSIGSSSSSARFTLRSHPLSDLTNAGATRVSFSKSPNPRRSLSTTALSKHTSSDTSGSSQKQQQRQSRPDSTSVGRKLEMSVHAEKTISLDEYERLERERNRYEKMYEHQKTLYEEMAERQSETYKNLQEKIIEVVALSTRNEENKRFIRQLKREMADSRTRVMNIQNRALEETKMEKSARERYQTQMREQKEKYTNLLEEQEVKVTGLESLLKDVMSMKGECDQVQISQLDALLKASYAKNTALFGDLLRQGRQIDMLFDSKASLERQMEQLRRERREAEAAWAEERRRIVAEAERYTTQIAEQQHSILELRRMLIRALEPATLSQDGHDVNGGVNYNNDDDDDDDDDDRDGEDDDDDDDDDDDGSSCSSSSSSYSEGGSQRRHDSDGNGDEAISAKAEAFHPSQLQTDRSLERRATALATLSAQIQSKLKVLPAGRI